LEIKLFFKQIYDVVTVSEDQKSEKDYHTYDLSVFHKFIAGFSPEDHLINNEHDKSSVERRNW